MDAYMAIIVAQALLLTLFTSTYEAGQHRRHLLSLPVRLPWLPYGTCRVKRARRAMIILGM
jgi:hypothetical protein